ncbi:MAG TPA: S8 family peptidase, partial [Thermoanaerobaculia bacterium]|nr:S8 family peptidase [Thermoanaerobaculia bacterium]
CHAAAVHNLHPSIRGTGVLLGIVDAGIDFRHGDFRNADGTSRIRFLWDQNDAAVPGAAVPFGRVFTKAELDQVLANQPGAPAIAHRDLEGHGTHVAGIAGGNGRGAKSAKFTGMAPESEYLIVVTRGDSATLGQSNAALAAFTWIVDRAAELSRPVAINNSQGMNGGGHCGESLLEVGMDRLARRAGVAIIKSAGNEQTWRTHAGGTVTQGQTRVVELVSGASNFSDDILEIWHDGADTIAIAVQAPGAPTPAAADFVVPGGNRTSSTSAQNEVTIDSTVNASDTGDVRTVVFMSRGNAPRIQPGTWRLHLRGDSVSAGRYDVWIERSGNRSTEQARFSPASNDPTRTISIPGTARRIITAGSYITRTGTLGQISDFSSRGPTRYDLHKPEITAPGEQIVSCLSSASHLQTFKPRYTLMAGTSMAAPHVTGAAALLLQMNPGFNCSEVKQLLMRSASRSGFAASAPDETFGDGKLNIEAAVQLARTAVFPVISNVKVQGTVISWTTDVPTTAAVRFNTHQRRMLLGRASGSLADLTLGTSHSIDLHGQPPGTYFCEILAFTAQDWQALDDHDGLHYQVTV